MRTIPLTHGYVALVDDEDYALVSAHKWHVHSHPNRTSLFYARTNLKVGHRKYRGLYMHHLLMQCLPLHVDHRDGDGLNNQRSNLRPATRSQNMANRQQRSRHSRFKGVWWTPRLGKWRAVLQGKGFRKHLGYFSDESVAAEAFDLAASSRYGEFARLNISPKRGDEALNEKV